jgi:two-component system, NarL family, nitrate/nitrite response regulator NarL
MVRVEIVDDHAVVRAGLRLLIQSRADFSVVAEAGTVREAVAAAEREQPDIILLDLALGTESGLDALPSLKEAAPRARVLVLTGVADVLVHEEAVRRGALGVLMKESAAETLLKAIEKIHAGETWLNRTMTARLLAELEGGVSRKPPDPHQKRIETLTARERQVVALVTRGLRNKEIACNLYISEATVRHHLTSIFGKLEVADRLTLTIYAFEHSLVPPEQ